MAIDTLQKRRSSLYSLMPFFTPSVSIDGTMSQADRQELAWAYSGIVAAAPPVPLVAISLSAVIPLMSISAKKPVKELSAEKPVVKMAGRRGT